MSNSITLLCRTQDSGLICTLPLSLTLSHPKTSPDDGDMTTDLKWTQVIQSDPKWSEVTSSLFNFLS